MIYCLQITKSIIALLRYYNWRKFTIITEEPWKSVAESLRIQAFNANMTINQFQTIFDPYKCCEQDRSCCNNAHWYSVVQETMINTRSTYSLKCNHTANLPIIILFNYYFTVYVFLGAPKSLVNFMTTMQALQLFDNGDYMVIFADTKINTQKDFRQYLWSNLLHVIICNCS